MASSEVAQRLTEVKRNGEVKNVLLKEFWAEDVNNATIRVSVWAELGDLVSYSVLYCVHSYCV